MRLRSTDFKMVRPRTTDSTKKRLAKARLKRYRENRKKRSVIIGDQCVRWTNIKEITGCISDEKTAEILIDAFLQSHTPAMPLLTADPGEKRKLCTPETSRSKRIYTGPMESTPVPGTSGMIPEPMVSSVSEVSSTDEGERQGTEIPIEKIEFTQAQKNKGTRVGRMTTSESDDMYDVDYDPDDPTYDPGSFELSIVAPDQDSSDDEEGEDNIVNEVHDFPIEDLDHPPALETEEGVPRITIVTENDVTEEKYIVTKSALEILLMQIIQYCSKCGDKCSPVTKVHGCTVIVNWACKNGHIGYSWAGCPMLPRGVLLLNILVAICVVLSGNNWEKVSLFAKFMKLSFPSRTSFFNIQNKCVIPVVDRYWENVRKTNIESLKNQPVIVSGDGRMDSPGFSAKLCTYTMMDQANKTIIALEVIDKREVELKSTNMESLGFDRSMTGLLNRDKLDIKEVVTDAHPQISAKMKKKYSRIRHSYDLWHGAKNLNKKLAQLGSTKGNDSVNLWRKHITNHFFHCAEESKGSCETMTTRFTSLMNHVVNKHKWMTGECSHGPLEEERDKPWLKRGSSTVKELGKVIFDKRLLRSLRYYVTAQTTSELESFNNHLLMYAPKRNAFSYAVYRCRCQLAAIDYSKHLNRQVLLDKNGKERRHRAYSKAAGRWSTKPLKEQKVYSYIPSLTSEVINEFTIGKKVLRQKAEVLSHDPKTIRSTIAAVSPPPTSELQDKQVPRLKKGRIVQ